MQTILEPTTQAELPIPLDGIQLTGDLIVPEDATGLVLFAHGSGSSRKSSRNRFVASTLHERGIGTLLFDLLTIPEEREDAYTAHLRFNIDLLSERLIAVADWIGGQYPGALLGFFGASTGAAAALNAAAHFGSRIKAVVSRGGRPDLASALPNVTAPTLLVIGSLDTQVIDLNEQAFAQLRCVKHIELVLGATHLFEEPGALQQAAALAGKWFATYLR
jgi:alpha-beta hydrolase superfamily lysophospholipase